MDPGTLTFGALTLVICGFGLIGNVLCVLVLSHKDMSSGYVYNLLGLTFSDTILLVLSALRTLNNMQVIQLYSIPHVAAPIFISDWICTSGTKYYTVAISLERLFVITHPVKAHTWLTVQRSKIYSFSILVFVICLSLFSYLYYSLLDSVSYPVYAIVVLHITPFLIVAVCNVFIFVGIRRFEKRRKDIVLTAAEASEESVTKMLFAVVTVFGFCYSFEIARQMMVYFYPDYMSSRPHHYDYTINILADVFYVLNSSVNFIIYCLLGPAFRTVFFNGLKAKLFVSQT